MTRVRLGRRAPFDDAAGDPLDGLVNLFDIGIVLAVAFLLAGLGLTADPKSGRVEPRDERSRSLPAPQTKPPVRGRGRAVGRVYRLSDGRLVYVEDAAEP